MSTCWMIVTVTIIAIAYVLASVGTVITHGMILGIHHLMHGDIMILGIMAIGAGVGTDLGITAVGAGASVGIAHGTTAGMQVAGTVVVGMADIVMTITDTVVINTTIQGVLVQDITDLTVDMQV